MKIYTRMPRLSGGRKTVVVDVVVVAIVVVAVVVVVMVVALNSAVETRCSSPHLGG